MEALEKGTIIKKSAVPVTKPPVVVPQIDSDVDGEIPEPPKKIPDDDDDPRELVSV